MKITAFLLLAICLHVSATSLAQNVTLSEHKAPLEKVLNDIRQQSGYVFFYNQDWMQQAQPVEVNVSNMPLDEALKLCFRGQPFDYAIVNRTIVLKLKEFPYSAKIPVPPVTVTGKVTDELGNPIIGVTVKQKDNPNNGSVTDAKGNYSLFVPDNNTVVSFSYVGYDSQELKAKDIPSGSVIILKVAENNLREVVINKGYYYEKKELSTGDVSVVGSKTIEQQPVSDPIQALIGQVAGLNIQQTSGVPGAYATIHIRGLNSIANGNDPYYIVDGVPFSAISLTDPKIGGGAFSMPNSNQNTGAGLSPFSALNPDDIESIEVLKDADATSIYGSKGANGVIIITTKKGKVGETKVNVNLNQGIGQVGHFMNLLGTQQYLQMRHEAFANDAITFPSINENPNDNNYDVNGVWDTTRYTNWQKVLIGNTAHYTNAQAGISGGNANTQFMISGGYYRSTTVFPGDYDDRKGSLHFSLTNTSINQRFKVTLTASYVNENNDVPSVDLTQLTTLAPDAPSLHNANGSLNWQSLNGTYTFSNPLSYTFNNYLSVTNNLISNLTLSYEILPGLLLSGGLGYNHDELNQNSFSPSSGYPPPYNTPSNSDSELATNYFEGWLVQPQLSYKKTIGRGELNALVGVSLQQSVSQYFSNLAYDFPNDALISDPAAAAYYQLINDQYSLYRYEELVARIGYTWEDKYL
ncbi:MAG: SusC/RagA family TonB-linked outer membrane protein, partial [Bacteroidetes bacterium]|nr:SusC/RagA family TonB-linked outer membrane protein [Bacteroidota bacterium]